MIILQASGRNFQSYQEIDFDYSGIGLALVSGPTGAGKSTLLDLVPWALYGVTSKEGSSDDVRPWGEVGPTSGEVTIGLLDVTLVVTRTRAPGKNDLYWIEYSEGFVSNQLRGKDLTDTQRLLDARLGVNSELFILSSYMTQFSKADGFFVASAKDRRKVLEKISDQSFAVNLGEKTSEARKVLKKELADEQAHRTKLQGQLAAFEESLLSLFATKDSWTEKQAKKIEVCAAKLEAFDRELSRKKSLWNVTHHKDMEDIRQKMQEEGRKIIPAHELVNDKIILERRLSELRRSVCNECGAPNKVQEHREIQRSLDSLAYKESESNSAATRYQRYASDAERLERAENPFGLEQENPHLAEYDTLSAETNPFVDQMIKTTSRITTCTIDLEIVTNTLRRLQEELDRLNWLYDKSFELRGVLMENAVSRIQMDTNGYLERFFDATIRVTFSLTDSDKLDVEIHNQGNTCPFTSLSGGERCMLKLAFTLSLMRAAQDKAGVSFNVICLDEPFNGLDESLKERAFGLLQEIAGLYETVLVIEHSESTKILFDTRFSVDKSSGYSKLSRDE